MKKSEKVLSNALLTLLQEKSFSKISVKNLCETADVNRSTFYANFEDKYQLLSFCLDSITQQVVEEFFKENDDSNLTKQIFEIVAKYQYLFHACLLDEENHELRLIFQNLIAQQFEDMLFFNHNTDSQISSQFFAGAILGVVSWWLTHHLQPKPEMMGERLARLLPLLDSREQ